MCTNDYITVVSLLVRLSLSLLTFFSLSHRTFPFRELESYDDISSLTALFKQGITSSNTTATN